MYICRENGGKREEYGTPMKCGKKGGPGHENIRHQYVGHNRFETDTVPMAKTREALAL